MKKIIQLLGIIIAVVIFITSCTIQKRLYMPGYDVEWKKFNISKGKINVANNNYKTTPTITTTGKISDNNNLFSFYNNDAEIKENLIASVSNSDLLISTTTKLPQSFTFNNPKDSCDNIILRDGTEIQANVVEVGVSEIKYKKCNQQVPLYSVSKSKVFMIKYSNGTKDVIKSSSKDNSGSESQIANGMSIAGLVCGITSIIPFSGIVFGILGIVFGSDALKKIRNNPDKYKPNMKKMAKAGITCGIIGLFISGIVLIIIIAV